MFVSAIPVAPRIPTLFLKIAAPRLGKTIYPGSKRFNFCDGESSYFKVDDFNTNLDHSNMTRSTEKFNLSDQKQKLNLLEPGYIVFPKRGAAIFKNRVGILKISEPLRIESDSTSPNIFE
jgi:hypothetical protein